MPDNYVEIKIKASDTAKPDLTELKADLDELGRKSETVDVKVDDEDAKRKLLEINAELARLNSRTANAKIKTAGAAKAESDINKVRRSLDDLIAHAERSNSQSGKGGLIGRMLFGLIGGGGEGGGGVAGEVSSLIPALSGLGGALAGLGLAGLVTEVTALASGFAAAGAGVGAFALLAMPAFSKIKTAYTQINAAQLAYNQATTKAGKATALAHLHDALKALDPAERGALKGIDELRTSFGKMAKAFEPAAFRVFNDALKIANTLMPDLKPFANDAAKAIDGLLKSFNKFAGSKDFKDWLKQFEKLSGPSITAIGHGIGQVAIAIGKLLTSLSKKDVVHAINIAFDILKGTIDALTWIVKRAAHQWDAWSHVIDDFRKWILRATHDIAADFDAIRHGTAVLAHDIASYFDEIRANIARWVADVGRDISRVVHFFEQLPGRVRSGLSSLASMLFRIGVNAIMGLVHGIESMFGAVAGAVAHLAGLIPSAISHILGIFSPSRVTFKHGQMIGQGLIDGMESMHGGVSAAAMRLAGSATPRGYGHGPGLPGGGGAMRLQLEWTGGHGADQQFLTWLSNNIRVRGGNVQKVLGH